MRDWVHKHGVFLLAAAFFAAYAGPFLKRSDSQLWRKTFRPAAERMLAGEPIHRLEEHAYAYPPAMAMFSVPLAKLPPRAGDVAWYLISVAATCAAVAFAWRLAGGPPFQDLSTKWRTILLAGGLLAARHLLSPLENQTFDALIAALLLGGSLLLAKSRDVAGAAAIGAAAAMKLTPLLFAPYLAWRGKWKAAAVVVAVAAAINLAPDVLWPQSGGRLYLETWQTTFLSAAVRNAPGAWIPERQSNRTRSGNQSLAGLFSRYAMFGLPTSIEQVEAAPGVPSPGRSLLIRGMTYGAIAALLLISAGIFRRSRRRASSGDFHLTAMECAVVLCLMLLASPMTSKSHYAALVLPCFLLARTAVETRRPPLLMVLAVLAITGPLGAKDLIGASLAEMLLFWGAPTWFAMSALAGMFFLLTAPGPCPPPTTDLDNSGQIAEIAVFTGIPECQGSQILRGRREKDTDDDAPPALPFLFDCPPEFPGML